MTRDEIAAARQVLEAPSSVYLAMGEYDEGYCTRLVEFIGTGCYVTRGKYFSYIYLQDSEALMLFELFDDKEFLSLEPKRVSVQDEHKACVEYGPWPWEQLAISQSVQL